MEIIAEGLWGLADEHQSNGDIGKSIKCLEAICKSQTSVLPITEVKTRLRIATLLLKYTHNIDHAKLHLERSQLLLKSIPSCFDLKCRTFSLLSHCYQIFGATPNQKQVINKGLELVSSSGDGFDVMLWSCNFYSQLANALAVEGDYQASIEALERGMSCAAQIYYPELQMFFATSMMHVHLMQWADISVVERAENKCKEIWESISPDKREQCNGLFVYNELLLAFYHLRTCELKKASQHIDKLDAFMKLDLQKTQQIKEWTAELNSITERLSQSNLQYMESSLLEKKNQLEEQLRSATSQNGTEALEPSYFASPGQAWGDKLDLAPPPIDGKWLPRSAVYALVDLMVVIMGRPKGQQLKDSGRRIQSGLHVLQVELTKLGITDDTREVDLHHSSIEIAGVYLMLLMQFLENKVALDLTRSEFTEAQRALVQMKNWFARFPTILQGCESVIQMLRGQYAHSLGCFHEAAFHFIEAGKLAESKSMQAMCQVYAAVSYICIGDAESSSRALDLIGPVHSVMDSFVGVREKTGVLFAYGLLLMKQHNLQEARSRLATGLKITHQHLGNIQLVSQYLTILGSLALTLHDNAQAREILKSSLTLSKTQNDLPTQVWVLSVLTALYKELRERGNEKENSEFGKKKEEDLKKRLADARSSVQHFELIERVKLKVPQLHGIGMKHGTVGSLVNTDLDIPESVGLMTPSPASSRLVDRERVKRGKRRL